MQKLKKFFPCSKFFSNFDSSYFWSMSADSIENFKNQKIEKVEKKTAHFLPKILFLQFLAILCGPARVCDECVDREHSLVWNGSEWGWRRNSFWRNTIWWLLRCFHETTTRQDEDAGCCRSSHCQGWAFGEILKIVKLRIRKNKKIELEIENWKINQNLI